MLDVQVAGDEASALLQHGTQHPFATLVYESDFVEIHDALARFCFTVCPFPGVLQFVDPRRDETATEGPTFYPAGFGHRDL